jgi:hypothetical protein
MALWAVFANQSCAATFTFGSDANNFNSAATPSTSLTSEEFAMQLAAGPSGAILHETTTPTGMGVASALIGSDVDPGGLNSFNVLQGSLEGVSEYIEFSFARPGLLTGLNFDGMSDEKLEFFTLISTGGLRINFVDSAANASDHPNPDHLFPVDEALSDGALVGDVVYLLEINTTIDDEVKDLEIPFAAGQVFTLSYAYLGHIYGQQAGDGSTLQGITVRAVPEPATSLLAVMGGDGRFAAGVGAAAKNLKSDRWRHAYSRRA